MLIDSFYNREDLVGLRKHLVFQEDNVTLNLPNVTLHLADIPFDPTEPRVVPQQNFHHRLHLIFNTPQIRERGARDLLWISRINFRFSHYGII